MQWLIHQIENIDAIKVPNSLKIEDLNLQKNLALSAQEDYAQPEYFIEKTLPLSKENNLQKDSQNSTIMGASILQRYEKSKNKPEYHKLINDIMFFLKSLDNVKENWVQEVITYAVHKQFCCLRFNSEQIIVYLKLDFSSINCANYSFSIRDVGHLGHHAGACNVELKISSQEDFEQTKELMLQAWALSVEAKIKLKNS